ncbi:hypothetical protein H5410_015400 [Solanum commersonii]|uniref:glutamate synthase (ferredoxin) n=1 Tax=Solanum commersonii TaxID=4109 RepID=A0A9J5ZTQ5_SOLCO|nr:hypothetical protein H5410_015400 [Solanum commersonii]
MQKLVVHQQLMKASVNAIFGFGAEISKCRDVSDFGTAAFTHCIAITALFSFTCKRIFPVADLDDILSERGACGVGFIANLDNKASHGIVKDALVALGCMEHRGGCGADNDSGDGSGLMTSIPWDLFNDWAEKEGIPVFDKLHTGVGMIFLPKDSNQMNEAKKVISNIFNNEGLEVLGWRSVPVDSSVVGYYAKVTMPNIQQVFVRVVKEENVDDIERELYICRKLIERAVNSEIWGNELYFCSLSNQTIVYKGMLRSEVLGRFYYDLQSELYTSPLAIYHRRFSTNTSPRWPLAQPMRFLGHNGEINTIQGNLNWMQSREASLKSAVWRDREDEIRPFGNPKASDSANLDSTAELLIRSGRAPEEALMILVPEAYQNHPTLSIKYPEVLDFYNYYKGQMEAWDGPALLLFRTPTMAADTIYFAVGFKSYDITRVVSKEETWYDWVERGRNRVTRMTVSQKTMEWLVYALKEASKDQGNFVRRWKVWDHSTEFFCSKNFNKDGRYISIIKTQGKRRAVIFIPEWSLNFGWMDISTKITRFINAKAQKISKVVHRKTEEGLLYSDSVRNNKWTTRELNAAKIQQKGNSIIISEVTTKSQNELLEKSVVGSFPEEIPNVTLSEVRRWVVSSWKHYLGINIYELGHNRFLFEFLNKTVADHTISGEWFWKSHKFFLEWWPLTSTATSERLNQVWIRVVGILLQLWSQKVFCEIKNFCGGWIQTEEETELRNHLKWARLKIRGDGDDVLSFVELVHEGLTFKVQI